MTLEAEKPPKYAYHLEGQPEAVLDALGKGLLILKRRMYWHYFEHEEMGQSWISIPMTGHFLAMHCNIELLNSLKEADYLTVVLAPDYKAPWAAFGRDESPIAAVIAKQRELYRMPLFNLKDFLKNNDIELKGTE